FDSPLGAVPRLPVMEDTSEGGSGLLPIGQVARAAGLSVKALRHYERVGVLQPFEVDAATGYRRYTAEQVEVARTIRRLRDLDVPLSRISTILADGDPQITRRELEDHLATVEAETWRLQRILHRLRRTIDGEEHGMSDVTEQDAGMDRDEERALA